MTFNANVTIDEGSKPSALARIRQEVSKPLAPDLFERPVPERPHIVITYDSRIDKDESKRILEELDPDGKGKPDLFDYNALVLAAQCKSIAVDGEIVKNEDGSSWTMRSSTFMEDMEAFTTVEAIRKLFGRDSDVTGHFMEISERNRSDREAANPTR